MNSTRHTIRIDAPPSRVYAALLDPQLIPHWRVPAGMRCEVHAFDASESGAFRVSLTYETPDGAGKSSDRTDTYHGVFEQLVPDALIVERLEFETADPLMQGEMRITTRLAPEGNGTRLTALHENLPPGVAAADNEAGWNESLAKLAALLQQSSGPDEHTKGPFYHGTKADLKVGDLVTPGYRSNYAHGRRTSRWVYMSAILSAWAAELASGDGLGRIYVVEPTGPFEDDPDLTDKRFEGNPTKSYRSRHPLRVVGEVTGWEGHTAEEIATMQAALAQHRADQTRRLAAVPDAAAIDSLDAEAEALSREWADDAEYAGCVLRMTIAGADASVAAAMTYASASRGESRTFELPRTTLDQSTASPIGELLSGRATEVTAWRDGWTAVIESCITEIGLSREARLWVAVDASHDTLRFRLEADGPRRSWERTMTLAGGRLTDEEQGEIWDFSEGRFSD